jgi:hypothetical protein
MRRLYYLCFLRLPGQTAGPDETETNDFRKNEDVLKRYEACRTLVGDGL